MKKMTGAAVIAALGVLSSTAMAEAVMPISANVTEKISVNGVVLENAAAVKYEDTTMIPLRAVCEELGFEVNWNDEARRIEIVNMPVYITCTPDEDGYTFARTAPMKIGKAPIMIDNRTYVPINFVDEILQGEYTEENGINITWGEEKTDGSQVYIKEKTEDGLLVEDFYKGEIKLLVTDETVIKNAEGEDINFEDIDETRELIVKYSDAMTMSIPPMTNALEITVTNEIAKTVLEGEVTEVIKDEEGKVSKLVLGDNESVLNVGEDLIVTDYEGNAADVEFEKGMEVRALTKGIATMSLPPQYPVTHIIVNVEKEEAESGKIAAEGFVVYAKEKGEDRLLIDSFIGNEIMLNITDETVIKNLAGEEIAFEDLDITKELVVKYSDAMTKSLPPITNAIEITVTDNLAKAVLEGEVTEVIKNEEGKVSQLVLGDNESVLNIGEDIAVTDSEGNEIDAEFEKGMNVRALTTGIATMSIPPQYPVTDIIVLK